MAVTPDIHGIYIRKWAIKHIFLFTIEHQLCVGRSEEIQTRGVTVVGIVHQTISTRHSVRLITRVTA